jgi:hypothetical protein
MVIVRLFYKNMSIEALLFKKGKAFPVMKSTVLSVKYELTYLRACMIYTERQVFKVSI